MVLQKYIINLPNHTLPPTPFPLIQMGITNPNQHQNPLTLQPTIPKTKVPSTQQKQNEQDIYILQNLSNMNLKGKKKQKYLWIDSKIFNNQNQKYQNYLKEFIDVEGCSTVDGFEKQLKQYEEHQKVKLICAASLIDSDYTRLQNNPRITSIYLFCQNKQKSKLLINNFPKIKSAKFDIIQLKDHLLQQQNQDQGLDPKTNILLTIQQDTNLMNNYRINFYSLTSSSSTKKSKTDFLNFAKKFYAECAAEIAEFQINYKLNISNKKQSAQQTINWLIKPGFFWESTQTLPKITTNPKQLAYLRFPIKQSYQAILQLYRTQPKFISQVFMVLTPTQQQSRKLKEGVTNFLIFTTFAKGYTSQKSARQLIKKNQKSILIRIMMKLPPSIFKQLDFGYVITKSPTTAQDVIFNIYNVFQIREYQQQHRQMTLQYGSLAQLAFIRQNEQRTRLTQNQQKLLRNYDYLQDIMSRVRGQATILQMSGYFQDSLSIYHHQLQQVRKSQSSKQVIDQQIIQLGDAYKINQEFTKAQEQFLSIKQGKMKLIADVHLAQLYFKTKQSAKLQKIIKQIQKNLSKYKSISQSDSFKAQNYIGMQLMNRGKYKQAGKLYKSLSNQINLFYNFQFQGIPLVHQIYRNRAACQTKLNNFTQALILLDSTKTWQKVCQGNKSPGLILTQNLIKSAYQCQGQVQYAKQCEGQITKMKKIVSAPEHQYLNRSTCFISLNQSLINIQTSNSSQY